MQIHVESRNRAVDSTSPQQIDRNPYEAALSNFVDVTGNIDPLRDQSRNILNWSIFSTEMSYIKCHDQDSYTTLNHSSLYDRFSKQDTDPSLDDSEIDDRFDEITAVLHTAKQFNENFDISTTYLGKYLPNEKNRIFDKVNEIPLRHNCTAQGALFCGTTMKVLFDTGATRSYMSKSFYMATQSLQTLPKLACLSKGIQVGSGQFIPVLFAIPIIVMIEGHLFEIFTTVCDIHDGIDLVFGLQNMIETEGEMSAKDGCYRFISRSIPIYPQHEISVPKDSKIYLKFQVPFAETLNCFPIAKFFSHHKCFTMKLRLQNNKGIVEFHNHGSTTVSLTSDKALGILDLRSLGYFKVAFKELVRHLEEKFNVYHYCKLHSTSDIDSPDQFASIKVKTKSGATDPYPWLEKDDPRRTMSDAQILYDRINLKDSKLTSKEKSRLMNMILEHKKAFSLRDEIGHCPNIVADIKVIDDSSFFVRPFPISESDKPFMDKQMERLVSLGILSQNSTSHTSPVMLITRKLTNDKRPVVDFRLLNTRILRRNTSIPLMTDVLNILGNSKCEILTSCDLKDAYHSLKLSESSKEYCGILPYFGSPIYRYEVLPMGIACAPQIWMDYITMILNGLEQKSKFIAIMDDLLIHSTKAEHWKLVETLFKTMIKNGLKLSPKKCQFFKTSLTYMGNDFVIRGKEITITPLKSRTEAIQKIPQPKTPKDCKSFCGVVNYLSLFCKDLQRLLKPIVALTRKGMPFLWGREQQTAFEQIKKQLQEPPVLHLPRADGRIILYSDTSREGTGSSLWQIQEGQPKLIGYGSKTLPDACKRYSVTELEMTGLLVNMGLWKTILKHREFDAAVDHAAVVQILKAKTEPATTRIKTLLERLAAYSFNLYYVKGKDMILADYLSRYRLRDTNPNDLIPLSFYLTRPYSAVSRQSAQFLAMTRSKAAKTGEAPPAVHGVNKGLDPHVKPEKQSHAKPQTKLTQPTFPSQPTPPHVQQALPSVPRSNQTPLPPIKQAIPRPPIPNRERVENRVDATNWHKYTTRRLDEARKQIPGIDTGELEEVLDPEIKIPTKDDFIKPQPLQDLVDPSKLTHRFLPKQGEIDRLIKQINRKILRDTSLPGSLADLKASYLTSPHFRDIYVYLTQNKVPLRKEDCRRLENHCKSFLILDGLLFKIQDIESEEPKPVLCIPTSKAHIIMDCYHSSMLGGHTGITKCYLTISQRFYIPNLPALLRAYITGCHICQLFKTGKQFQRPFQKRININVPSMTKVSMDIKQMIPSNGYSHILVLLCEVSNFLVALPLHSTKTQTIIEAFERGYLGYFGPPTHIICDQDPAFTSSLMEAFSKQLNIQLIMVSPTNHKSLLAEHGIKSLSNILVKHLSQTWSWYNILPYAMLCYNSYSTPNLDNYSPFELVFGYKMMINKELEKDLSCVVSASFSIFYEKLKKNLNYMRERLQKFRSERTDFLNRNRKYHSFEAGQIVYVYQAKGTIVQTGSRKIACYYLGPLVIYKAIGPNQFILMSLTGEIYPHLIEETRLKAGYIHCLDHGNVTTLAQLKQVLSAGLKIASQNQ